MSEKTTDYIEIHQGIDAEWRWRMKAPNHEIIAVSGEGYTNRTHAVEMALRVSHDVIPVFNEDGDLLDADAETWTPVPEVVDEDGAPL